MKIRVGSALVHVHCSSVITHFKIHSMYLGIAEKAVINLLSITHSSEETNVGSTKIYLRYVPLVDKNL